MPTLEVLDQDGRLIDPGLASATVLATMLYPSDEAGRDGFVAAAIQTSLQSAQTRQDIPTEIAKLTYEQGGGPGIEQQGLKVLPQGAIAGEVLIRVLQLAAHAPEHASIRKAQHLVERSRTTARDGRDKPMAASPTSIETAWGRFKAVAHLWAAFISMWNDDVTLLDDKQLPELLSGARYFAVSAARHVPPGMGNKAHPVLDLGEIWMVPDSTDIPVVTLEPPALDEKERDWLADYTHT